MALVVFIFLQIISRKYCTSTSFDIVEIPKVFDIPVLDEIVHSFVNSHRNRSIGIDKFLFSVDALLLLLLRRRKGDSQFVRLEW